MPSCSVCRAEGHNKTTCARHGFKRLEAFNEQPLEVRKAYLAEFGRVKVWDMSYTPYRIAYYHISPVDFTIQPRGA